MQRKPTMNDVARTAGVGAMTVSRVLNGSSHVLEGTAERVRKAVAQLGYHPNEMARALRNFKSRTIGLLLPNLHDPFFATCAHALNMVAKEHGYTVLLTLTNDDSEHEYLEAQRMMQRHVEGLVIIPANSDVCKLGLPEFAEIPIVTMDRPIGEGPDGSWEAGSVDSVVTENELGARMATEHLIKVHGHRRILFLGHRPGLYTMERRCAGYIHAMQEAGLPTETNFACTNQATAMQILGEALAQEQPLQAIFSANNLTTRRVLSALLRLRLRVPQEVALVGFDDLELGDLLHPALTVVRQPMEELGLTAGRMLFAKMRKGNQYGPDSSNLSKQSIAPATQVVLPLEFVVRHSCGCPYELGAIAAVPSF